MKLKRIFTIMLIILCILSGVGMVVYLLGENDEAKLEHWIRSKALEIPHNRAEDFLSYVNLKHYGFKLNIQNKNISFNEKEKKKFLHVAKTYVQILKGSSLELSGLKIKFNDDGLADVTLNVHYRAGKGSEVYLREAILDVKMKIVAEKGTYKVTAFAVALTRNPVKAALQKK